jgi:hypothetical protein
LLSEWRIRAISSGYIQDIHPEVIALLAGEEDVRLQESEESEPDSATKPSGSAREMAPPSQSHPVVSAAGRL